MPIAEFVELEGFVSVGPSKPMSKETTRVSRKRSAKLGFDEDTALWIGTGSAISSSDGGKRVVRLESGRALARVAKRKGSEPFVLETPIATIEVMGTVFSARLGEGGLTVDLYEGSVRLVRGETVFVLAPGESARMDPTGVLVSKNPIDRASVLADLLIAEGTQGLPGAELPALSPFEGQGAVAPHSALPSPVLPRAPHHPEDARKKRPSGQEPRPPAPITPPVSMEDTDKPRPLAPGTDDILVVPVPESADESLFRDAYENARAGNAEAARKDLEKYFTDYPEGRHWKRVAEILSETP